MDHRRPSTPIALRGPARPLQRTLPARRAARPLARALPWALVLAALPALGACRTRRVLAVETTPPGATVRLDDDIVGTAPLELEFDHYGGRRLTFYQEGHRSTSRQVALRPPWWSRFPMDFVTEVLLPFGWRDVHRVRVRMVPESGDVSRPDFEAVLRRAEQLRRAGPSGPRPAPEEAAGGAAPDRTGARAGAPR